MAVPENESAEATDKTNKKSILIIGDMVVDDTWVVGEYRSATATHIGRVHYRSLHHAGSAVKQHCGAGRVASILRQARTTDFRVDFFADVSVLGIWATGDTEHLQRMFTPETLLGSNSYRMVPPAANSATAPTKVDLINLGVALDKLGYSSFTEQPIDEDKTPFITKEALHKITDKTFGTTRVYRLYKRSGNEIEQLGRLDWELSPQDDDEKFASWLPSRSKIKADDWDVLAEKLLNQFNRRCRYDAVVVKDNGKGVVSQSLLRILLESKHFQHLQLAQVPWFIQTKRWEPQYLDVLKEHKVRVPLVAYYEAALEKAYREGTILTAENDVSPEAMLALERLMASFEQVGDRRMCVFLPGGFSAVALASGGRSASNELIYQPHYNPDGTNRIGLPGSATAFFAALVYGMLQDENTSFISSRYLIEGALRVAQHWVETEYERLLHVDVLSAPSEIVLTSLEPNTADEFETKRKIGVFALEKEEPKPKDLPSVGKVRSFENMDDERRRWEESGKGCAIIRGTQDERFIELSRAGIDLASYVCRAPNKSKQIGKLIRAIKGFDPRLGKSLSVMLLAKPGSGKTSLLKSLQRSLGLQVLDFNITNMITVDDLLLSFDQVATTQIGNRTRKLLVFVDEVNAKISGQTVYESFLTPLEDGYYFRTGTKRFIHPCIWLFAGTASLDEIRSDEKGSDFASRLSLDPLNISDVPALELDYLYVENIYVGLLVARRLFPRLNQIHRDVVAVLGSLGKWTPSKFDGGETVGLNVSNRLIGRVMSRELHVDGLGRGNWADVDSVKRLPNLHLSDDRYTKNNDELSRTLGTKDWIRVYDSHPDYAAK